MVKFRRIAIILDNSTEYQDRTDLRYMEVEYLG